MAFSHHDKIGPLPDGPKIRGGRVNPNKASLQIGTSFHILKTEAHDSTNHPYPCAYLRPSLRPTFHSPVSLRA